MSLHEQCVGATDEWYTPPHVFDALGAQFDLDVASPGLDVTPWIPAKNCYLADQDGLAVNWFGFVWMNPPFGARNGIVPWLEKFFAHGSGIALTPDRTSAPWWQTFAPKADGILFISPKLKFIGANGKPGNSPAQGTTLLAAGSRGSRALLLAAERGLGTFAVPAPALSLTRPQSNTPEK
jgi:hypothetical protein